VYVLLFHIIDLAKVWPQAFEFW